jgi:hypothetical protein
MIIRPAFIYTNYARPKKLEFLYYLRKVHSLVKCLLFLNSTDVPPNPMIQYPRFTAARKKNLK